MYTMVQAMPLRPVRKRSMGSSQLGRFGTRRRGGVVCGAVSADEGHDGVVEPAGRVGVRLGEVAQDQALDRRGDCESSEPAAGVRGEELAEAVVKESHEWSQARVVPGGQDRSEERRVGKDCR